ncbi:MAG TPA: serine hydrolase domain-containing protein [Pyrinomonadaceae bacterium]|jgi:CubicO group peptidase (beta-lactamase class C family)
MNTEPLKIRPPARLWGFALALLAACLTAPLASAQDQSGERPSRRQGGLPLGAAPAPATGARFDLDKFEQNINKAFAGEKATGYAYAINVDGRLRRSGKGGVAQRARDHLNENGVNVPVDQSPTKRMNIASVTKTITAAAVLRAIQDKKSPGYPNLTINSKIDPFLPAPWARGPKVKDLTFKDLLSQYSGMNDNGGGTGGADLQKWIAGGVTREKEDFKYINGNIAIFRVILPYMLASEATRKNWNYLAQSDNVALNMAVSAEFRRILRETIFEPMGITDAEFKSADPVPTLLYNSANDVKGYAVGDWLLSGGGGGWFLSAVDLARFLAHLRYDDKILTPATRQTMYDFRLGWRPPKEYDSVIGKHGSYHAHGGALKYGPDESLVGMSSGVMDYGNGVQVALVINSLGSYGDKIALLRDAFDNAWVVAGVKAKP